MFISKKLLSIEKVNAGEFDGLEWDGNGMLLAAPPQTEIYTDAEDDLDGWEDGWNCCYSNTPLTVHYGVTRAEFDAL